MKTLWSLLKKKTPPTIKVRHWLIISSLFNLILLSARILTSGTLNYGFLAWNLVLAYIPFVISSWLTKHKELFNQRTIRAFAVSIWILFIPNSFYILTDLFHLENKGSGHPWFDLTLILSFAWNGTLVGMLSIRKMEMLLATRGKFISAVVICAVMWLNAFGIYIGRFLRFNSWDVIANPFTLFGEISEIVLNPYDYPYVWGMSFCFAVFMIILYYSSKKLAEPD